MFKSGGQYDSAPKASVPDACDGIRAMYNSISKRLSVQFPGNVQRSYKYVQALADGACFWRSLILAQNIGLSNTEITEKMIKDLKTEIYKLIKQDLDLWVQSNETAQFNVDKENIANFLVRDKANEQIDIDFVEELKKDSSGRELLKTMILDKLAPILIESLREWVDYVSFIAPYISHHIKKKIMIYDKDNENLLCYGKIEASPQNDDQIIDADGNKIITVEGVTYAIIGDVLRRVESSSDKQASAASSKIDSTVENYIFLCYNGISHYDAFQLMEEIKAPRQTDRASAASASKPSPQEYDQIIELDGNLYIDDGDGLRLVESSSDYRASAAPASKPFPQKHDQIIELDGNLYIDDGDGLRLVESSSDYRASAASASKPFPQKNDQFIELDGNLYVDEGDGLRRVDSSSDYPASAAPASKPSPQKDDQFIDSYGNTWMEIDGKLQIVDSSSKTLSYKDKYGNVYMFINGKPEQIVQQRNTKRHF